MDKRGPGNKFAGDIVRREIKYNFLRIASRGIIKTLLKGFLFEKVASLFYSLAGTMDSQEGTNIICTSSSFVAAMTSKCATS